MEKNQQAGVSTAELHDEFLEIIRSLAHRMSQPLTSLRGSFELALMGGMDAVEYRKILEQSIEDTDRITETLSIIREALDTEDSGRDSEQVCWKTIVTGVLDELAPFIERTQTRVVLESLPAIDVISGPLQLAAITRELFQECIGNSLAGRELHIRLGAEGMRAFLLIECQSLPNAPTAVHHQPESGLANSREEELELSQWILRHAIKRQNGRMEAEQLPSGETRYKLSLPLAPQNGA